MDKSDSDEKLEFVLLKIGGKFFKKKKKKKKRWKKSKSSFSKHCNSSRVHRMYFLDSQRKSRKA